ncbi:hypothetical protein TNCV_223861 [Trichonephila clavipes]|nr:hypothetical protein TNCV_223861 [Trichonephila clavipes]
MSRCDNGANSDNTLFAQPRDLVPFREKLGGFVGSPSAAARSVKCLHLKILILNRGQATRTTTQLTHPLLTTSPYQYEDDPRQIYCASALLHGRSSVPPGLESAIIRPRVVTVVDWWSKSRTRGRRVTSSSPVPLKTLHAEMADVR